MRMSCGRSRLDSSALFNWMYNSYFRYDMNIYCGHFRLGRSYFKDVKSFLLRDKGYIDR